MKIFSGLKREDITSFIITPGLHNHDTLNPCGFTPIPESLERYGTKCPEVDPMMAVRNLSRDERFKRILNTSKDASAAYDTLKDTDPRMTLVTSNLKGKLKAFYPVTPESKAFPLSSFSPAGLAMRDRIMVISRSDLGA